MNDNSNSGLLGMLKQKMQNSKEEVEKLKEKIAQDQIKLNDEKERRESCQNKIRGLEETIVELDECLAIKKDSLKEVNNKMEEVSKQSEADLRQGRVLKNKTTSDDDKMDKLEKELTNAVTIEKETAAKYSEVAQKIIQAETKLDEVELRAGGNERKKNELEEELKILSSTVTSCKFEWDKMQQKRDQLETQVEVMTHKCKEAEVRATGAEQGAERLQVEVDRLETTLAEKVEANNAAETELDSLFQDLRNMASF